VKAFLLHLVCPTTQIENFNMKNLRLIPDFYKPQAIGKIALSVSSFAHPRLRFCLLHIFWKIGTNLRYVHKILGHGNSKTTEIYPHVSKESLANSFNPLDQAAEMQRTDNMMIKNNKTK